MNVQLLQQVLRQGLRPRRLQMGDIIEMPEGPFAGMFFRVLCTYTDGSAMLSSPYLDPKCERLYRPQRPERVPS